MKVIDPGHYYEVEIYDNKKGQHYGIVFMKREGEGYPGNVGHYPGTNSQELIRVLIDRAKYLNSQIPCIETEQALLFLRSALVKFEQRAARRHGLTEKGQLLNVSGIEDYSTCKECCHIIDFACKGHDEHK